MKSRQSSHGVRQFSWGRSRPEGCRSRHPICQLPKVPVIPNESLSGWSCMRCRHKLNSASDGAKQRLMHPSKMLLIRVFDGPPSQTPGRLIACKLPESGTAEPSSISQRIDRPRRYDHVEARENSEVRWVHHKFTDKQFTDKQARWKALQRATFYRRSESRGE